MMKHKQPMPRYYGKNIVQNAQRKFFKRKALEAERRTCRDNSADNRETEKKD